MRTRFPITAQLTVLAVGLVILTAFAVNEVYLRGSSRILADQAVHELEQEEEYQYSLDSFLQQLRADVLLTAEFQATKGLVRAQLNGGIDPVDEATAGKLKEQLANSLEGIIRVHGYYRRVHFIDMLDSGRELLRVERIDDRVERVPDSKLGYLGDGGHAKKQIQDALRFSPDDVYLSDIVLDREDGQISLPHTAVLSAVAPIYGPDKKEVFAIIIDVDFGALLADVHKKLSGNRTLYIANKAGDYLIHPDPAYLYASDLGHDHRIQRDFPRLLDVMANPRKNEMTFLPEDMQAGNVLVYKKFYYYPPGAGHYLGIAIESPYNEIVAETREVERQGFIFSFGIAALAAFLAIYFIPLFLRPLGRMANAVVRYRKGEKNIELPADSPDEIGILSREFQAMMRQKDEEDWVKESLVTISRDLLGFKDMEAFANVFMAAVTPALKAQIGVLYLGSTYAPHRPAGGREPEMLTFVGAWGYAGQSEPLRSFRWGEGMVGQCARDKETRLVTDIPEDYLRIVSALGDTKPKTILLQPLLFERNLVGVMEIASLNDFSEIQLIFLKQICFVAGIIVNTLSASQRTEELLEETRQAAEELQRSEEELKAQQEELEASNEEMEEKTNALEKQNAQIRRQTAELEENKLLMEEKARELEQANKYKSEFLANMSHELRTPLNSLLILARSLASNEEKNLTDEQVEEAGIIHNSGLELLNLINDILDLSKVEAGKLTMVVEDSPVEEMVRRLRQQFDPVSREKNLAFNIRAEAGVPETLHTDARRAEQILKNLLSNAFKFTEKGTVTLRVHRPDRGLGLQRTALTHDNTIAFSVADTGIGIDAKKLKDIFEAFQQEDGSIGRHYGGTGLGLTIARKFAHMLGGEIHVDSEKGRGSTFTLVLPVSVAAEAAKPVNPLPPPQAVPDIRTPHTPLKTMPRASVAEFIADDRRDIAPRDKVLLIIEDDRAFAATLMKVARVRGYKCLVAGDGKTGLLLAAENSVTAILLDLILPDMDGMQVLDQLKDDLRTRHIPVHIVTGRTPESSALSLRKGAIGYLAKPVEREGIETALLRIERLLQADVKQVLVVEDDHRSQIAIHNLLRQKDIRITAAGTGASALEHIRRTRFDCIILDLRLPDMSGFEWLERIEQEAGEAGLPPVIVYTAKELTEEENRALSRYTGNIIIKGAKSPERLLDEVTLFLHSVESSLSHDQQEMIRMQHDPVKVLLGRRVLLVDDDLRNTFALSRLLRKQGMNVVIADNGQMGLEKLREDSGIEAVIMDIMMPIMDGYQAIQAIRAEKAWQHLPIIALTARAMPEEQEKCMAAGANDYLTKPVDLERLLTLLRVWLFKQEMAA